MSYHPEQWRRAATESLLRSQARRAEPRPLWEHIDWGAVIVLLLLCLLGLAIYAGLWAAQ